LNLQDVHTPYDPEGTAIVVMRSVR